MSKARELSDYTGLQGDLAGLQTNITAGDTAARAGRKNLIINGDNRISQRGTYTSALDFVHNSYLLDRWMAGKSGGSIDGTITHSSDTVNGAVCKTQKYIVTTGHAGSWIGGRQILEFPETFIGRTVTISAWVKSNSDDARILLWNVGSGTNTAIATQAHTGGGAWEYLSSTGTVMAGTTGLTLYMATLTEAAGTVTTSTGDYIEFTNVQIELGSVATDFEYRSYGEELALCHRYYWDDQNTSYSNYAGDYVANCFTVVQLPTTMRVRPSVTGTPNKTLIATYHDEQRLQWYMSGNAGAVANITADAEL
jgi:hypothetical protein